MPIVLLFLYGYNGYVTSFKQGIGAKHSGNLAYLLLLSKSERDFLNKFCHKGLLQVVFCLRDD